MIPFKDRIEIHKFGLTIKQIIKLVENQIQSLSKEDLRKLYVLICSDYAITKEWLESSKNLYKEFNQILKKRYDNAIFAHLLYDRAGVDEKFRLFHWEHYRAEQLNLHNSFKSNAKPIRQDNKTYINYGSGHSNANKIRYPKICRKTAWKRFYKLFPHLNPENKIV